MEQEIRRIEKHIEALQIDRKMAIDTQQNAVRMVEACDNCIYTAQQILAMLRDGAPLSSERQEQPQLNGHADDVLE